MEMLLCSSPEKDSLGRIDPHCCFSFSVNLSFHERENSHDAAQNNDRSFGHGALCSHVTVTLALKSVSSCVFVQAKAGHHVVFVLIVSYGLFIWVNSPHVR